MHGKHTRAFDVGKLQASQNWRNIMRDRWLFKAKFDDSDRWKFGYLYEQNGIYCIMPKETGGVIVDGMYASSFFVMKVKEETICQCTGLKDKNGKLIWENDIVNCFESECCGKISWNESEAGFYFDVLLEDGTYEEEHIYDYADCMMVIGNIFDNPELLEG